MRVVTYSSAVAGWLAEFGLDVRVDDEVDPGLAGSSGERIRLGAVGPRRHIARVPGYDRADPGDLELRVVFSAGEETVPAAATPDSGSSQGFSLMRIEPRSFKAVLNGVLELGARLGCIDRAVRAVGAHEQALAALQRRLGVERRGAYRAVASVACVTGLEPLRFGPGWTSDVIEQAGANPVTADGTDLPSADAISTLHTLDPDVLCFALEGETVDASVRALNALAGAERWRGVRSVRQGRAYVCDGARYFNYPGPALYRSIELVMLAIHPERAPAAGLVAEDGEVRCFIPASRGPEPAS